MQLRRIQVEVAPFRASQATATAITSQVEALLQYDRQALLSACSVIALMSSYMSLRLLWKACEFEAGLFVSVPEQIPWNKMPRIRGSSPAAW
jgi:hypothetical protein